MKLPVQSSPVNINLIQDFNAMIVPSKDKRRGNIGLRNCQFFCGTEFEIGSNEQIACQDFCTCVYYNKSPLASCAVQFKNDLVNAFPDPGFSPKTGLATGRSRFLTNDAGNYEG